MHQCPYNVVNSYLTTRQLNENTKRIGNQASDYIDCIFIDCDDMQRGWVQNCRHRCGSVVLPGLKGEGCCFWSCHILFWSSVVDLTYHKQKTVFDHISKHLKVRHNTVVFWTLFQGVWYVFKHSRSCLICCDLMIYRMLSEYFKCNGPMALYLVTYLSSFFCEVSLLAYM